LSSNLKKRVQGPYFKNGLMRTRQVLNRQRSLCTCQSQKRSRAKACSSRPACRKTEALRWCYRAITEL
jgi:hypothetical protein